MVFADCHGDVYGENLLGVEKYTCLNRLYSKDLERKNCKHIFQNYFGFDDMKEAFDTFDLNRDNVVTMLEIEDVLRLAQSIYNQFLHAQFWHLFSWDDPAGICPRDKSFFDEFEDTDDEF